MNKAVLLGATGEMGRNILAELRKYDYYQEIYLLGRESILQIPNEAGIKKIVVDFEDLDFDLDILKDADIFSALGTGGSDNFEKLDYEYPVAVAELAQGRAKSFNIVSAMGANSHTSYRYLKVKGQMEEKIVAMDLPQVRFYRPSMLIAPNRRNLEVSEAIMIYFFKFTSPFMFGPLHDWRGIKPETVAKVMVEDAMAGKERQIYQYRQMVK